MNITPKLELVSISSSGGALQAKFCLVTVPTRTNGVEALKGFGERKKMQ